MNLYFLIFVIILFIYVHVNDQYRKSEDLEIYEMDYVSNPHLQTICNVKQPILFQYRASDLKIDEKVSVRIGDTNDYYNQSIKYVWLPYSSAETLFKTDPTGHYFTETPADFLEEKQKIQMDTDFKPNFSVKSNTHFMLGSPKSHIPIQYHTMDRKFLCVVSGKITVKMTPFRSHVYLNPIKNYENYIFYSRINVWNVQEEFKNDMDKIRFLEFDVHAGYTLYLPPYWWYSIQFSSVDTRIVGVEYQTAANVLAHSADLCKHYLQVYNTKSVPVKKCENVITI
jgi:hypothetical protein